MLERNEHFSHELKETISLSLPLIGSWLIYSLSGFIGTAMVARLGSDALAASVLVGILWMTVTVFFFGIFSSISILVSHQYGARQYNEISYIVGQGIILAILVCPPIMLSIFALPAILNLTAQTSAVTKLALEYGHAIIWSTPGVILLVVFEHFLNGIGRTKLSLWISVLEVPFEILFIYAFIYGKFGLPKCGIAGVGYGFTASYSITVIILMLYLARARFAQPFHIYRHVLSFKKHYFYEIIRVGCPIGITYLIEVTAFAFATFLMARFSTLILAAHQIVIQYMNMTTSAAYAISQAVGIRVGQNVGKQNINSVRNAARVGLIFSFSIMLCLSVIYMLFPHLLLRIDINVHMPHNRALMESAASLMVILGVFQLFDSMRIIETGALRGLKDTRFAMYASLFSFWVIGISSAYLFGFVYHLQGRGVWMGLTIGVIMAAFILYMRLRNRLKKIDLAEIMATNTTTSSS